VALYWAQKECRSAESVWSVGNVMSMNISCQPATVAMCSWLGNLETDSVGEMLLMGQFAGDLGSFDLLVSLG